MGRSPDRGHTKRMDVARASYGFVQTLFPPDQIEAAFTGGLLNRIVAMRPARSTNTTAFCIAAPAIAS
jgi:hypothetical protein